MVKLQDFSVVSGNALKPKNKCGGILTLTVLPALILIYALAWLSSWYNGNLGAVHETDIQQLQYGAGYRMSGSQELYCMAASGCWYTRYQDQSKCPPDKAVKSLIQRADSLTTLFTTGNIGQRNFELATKECAYATRGEKLEGVCVHSTPDPIDKVAIVWRVSKAGGAPDNFGVALKTEAVRQGSRTNVRKEDETERDISVDGLASEWFNWRTEGGGHGYRVSTTGTEIHYGEVELQVIRYSYEFMQPKPDAMQFIPRYSHTDKTPSDTNVCFQPNSNASNPPMFGNVPGKCQGAATTECAQLKLGPAATIILDTRSVVSPVSSFLGAVGGIIGLVLMALTMTNACLITVFGSKCSTLCAPDPNAPAPMSVREPTFSVGSTGQL